MKTKLYFHISNLVEMDDSYEVECTVEKVSTEPEEYEIYDITLVGSDMPISETMNERLCKEALLTFLN